jgi:antirestriction protein ArdC
MPRVEEVITDRIVKLLEAGTPPWHKPWTVRGVAPANAISQRPYSGINVLMLASQAYGSPYWLTFKQATEAKGFVKKGEHGSIVVFAKKSSKDVETDSGDVENRTYTVLRYYTLFNVQQTEGCKLNLPEPPALADHERIERCEQVIGNYPDKPRLTHDSPSRQFQAYYDRVADLVNVPVIGAFENPEHYYSVVFHELTHSTGHSKRLARDTLSQALRFGDTNYSREELVAEMAWPASLALTN